MHPEFSIRHGEVKAFAQEVAALLAEEPSGTPLLPLLQEIHRNLDGLNPVRIVFTGAYSSGKSSLIRCLTGDDSIKIGADVTTTEVADYAWRGLVLTDTPGVRAGETLLHDQIAERAIEKGDLILFLVTNEQFFPALLDFFRHLAVDRGFGGKMLLVVNKIDRETGTEEVQQESLRRQLSTVGVDGFEPLFLAARKYLDAQDTSLPAKVREKLETSSLFSDFVASLDQFGRSKGWVGRLVTPINSSLDLLGRFEIALVSHSNVTKQALELHLKRIEIIQETRRAVREICELEAQKYTSFCHSLCEETLSGLAWDKLTPPEVESKLQAAYDTAEQRSESLFNEVEEALAQEFLELQQRFAEFGEHHVFNDLGTPDFGGSLPGADFGSQIDGKTSSTGRVVTSAAKGAAKAITKDAVYKVGKWMGVKFKPWGAVKATKYIKGGAQALIAGIEIYQSLTEGKAKEKRDAQIAEARKEIRNGFKAYANEVGQSVRGRSDDFHTEITSRLECFLKAEAESLGGKVPEALAPSILALRHKGEALRDLLYATSK